jgi:gliding motility-associated-like protein
MRKQLFYISCALLMIFRSAAQTYSPVNVTGFNVDAVAEAQPSTTTAFATGIDIQEHIMYSAAYGTIYGTGTGLPNNGTIVNGTSTYQLQSYTHNNCLYILPGQTDSLILTTPTAFSHISLLAFATETQSTNNITFEFTDGTIYSVANVALKDWFGGTPYVIMGYDRATQPSGSPVFLTTDPRMYALTYQLPCADRGKLLRTIVVSDISPVTPTPTERTCVMAVSGTVDTPVSLTFTNTDPTCASGQNGTAMVNVANNIGTTTYTWSTTPAQTTNPATNLAAGPYTVNVINGGCTYVGYDTLVNSSGTATLIVTASPDSICAGSSSVLVASGGLVYTWSAGAATGNTDIVTPVATTTYNVSATTVGGCVATGSVTVVVKPIPPAPTISASGPTTFCQGDSVILTSSASSGDLWSDNETSPSITVMSTGTYTVVDSVDGCVSPPSAPLTVTVNPIPPPATITGGPDTFCQGGNVVLTSSATTGNIWSDAETTQSITVNTSGSYSVTQTLAGCTSFPSDTVAVVVNPIPPAPTITAGGPTTFCQGNNVVLSSSAGTGDLWSDNETTPSINVTSTGTYTVVDSVGGCVSPPSAPLTVTVNPLPPAPVISGSPLTFCQGDSVVLSSGAASGDLWSTGQTSQSITVYSSGSYTVTDTVNGCVSAPSVAAVVTVNPIPPAPVITPGDSVSICTGSSILLTSSAATGDVWSDGETTNTISVSSAGTYTVSQTLAGCTGPLSAPVTVSIIPLPAPVIITSQQAICPGGVPIILDATTVGATAYIWSNTSTQPTLTIDSPGTYTVTVTVSTCSASDAITISTEPLLGPLTIPDSVLLCMGDSAAIDATTLNATSYHWSGINDTTAIVSLHSEGGYEVTVSNSCGSLSASTMVVVRDCNCNIYMPNAFTPNGNGVNDKIGVYYDCPGIKYIELRIFDRWGEKVFESNDLDAQWDGTYRGEKVAPGIYSYTLDVNANEGNVNHAFHLKGTVTLIR